MPYYSFILVCRNQWNLTKQAITTLNDSFSLEHKKKGIELIVINNGSEDETKLELERLKDEVKEDITIVPIHLEENHGYLLALNVGFATSRGGIITILNNDLIFPENWFKGIVDTLERDPAIGAAAPHLSYASGEANVGVGFDSIEEMKKFSKQFMEDNKEKIIFTERVIGACVSMKRELVQAIGGNDFWFGFGFFDDDDWSLRTCIAGYKIAIVGASFVQHLGSVTAHQHSEMVGASINANGEKFAKKWNVVAGFDKRKLVDSISYSKEEHFFPVKKEDFNSEFDQRKKDPSAKSVLFAADWNNKYSSWKERLVEVKDMVLVDDSQLYLWIPELYFHSHDIANQAKEILGDQPNIHYMFNDIAPMDTLRFLTEYNYFISVQNDFINLHMKNLVEGKVIII